MSTQLKTLMIFVMIIFLQLVGKNVNIKIGEVIIILFLVQRLEWVINRRNKALFNNVSEKNRQGGPGFSS